MVITIILQFIDIKIVMIFDEDATDIYDETDHRIQTFIREYLNNITIRFIEHRIYINIFFMIILLFYQKVI